MYPQPLGHVYESASGDGLECYYSRMSLEDSQMMSLDDGMGADGKCFGKE